MSDNTLQEQGLSLLLVAATLALVCVPINICTEDSNLIANQLVSLWFKAVRVCLWCGGLWFVVTV